ncbi:MAG TPA: ABC transporter permease [Bacillota bacterium]|nr:ABC transporter permease [Bacillota bacterium]
MRLLSIAKKEFIQIRRDRSILPIIFILPIVQVIIFGYVATTDIRSIPFGVYDPHPSQASRELINRFTDSGYFKLVGEAERMDDLGHWLDQGKASVGLILRSDYAKAINAGQTAKLEVLLDGTDSNSASIAQNYIATILTNYSTKIAYKRLQRAGLTMESDPVDLRTRVWYNPELRATNYMVPGVIAMILMMITVMLTSLTIVKERERGTLEQLLVTPIKPWELVVGKLLPFPLIGLVQVLLIVTVGALWFNVPIHGSLLLLFGLSLVFIFSTLGWGLLISAVTQNQQQSMMISMFFTILNMLLSGFMTPISNMPVAIQWSTYILPGRYFLEIVRGIFLKSNGIDILWPQTAALLLMGVIMLTFSAFRLRKKLV